MKDELLDVIHDEHILVNSLVDQNHLRATEVDIRARSVEKEIETKIDNPENSLEMIREEFVIDPRYRKRDYASGRIFSSREEY